MLSLLLFTFIALSACEKDNPVDPVIEPEPDPIIDPEPEKNRVYINNQADFDTYKDKKFLKGALILFAAGEVFNGQFAPDGSGLEDDPIRLTAYNPETNEVYWDNIDNKPIINGNGTVNSPFYLYNVKNWEINNLEITNTNGSNSDQGDLRGIYIVAEDIGTVENVTVRNCYVHDVNGHVAGKLRGGIHVNVIGTKTKTKFHNLLIENNHVADVGGVGIGNQSSWRSIASSDYHPWTNYVVKWI